MHTYVEITYLVYTKTVDSIEGKPWLTTQTLNFCTQKYHKGCRDKWVEIIFICYKLLQKSSEPWEESEFTDFISWPRRKSVKKKVPFPDLLLFIQVLYSNQQEGKE